MNIIEIKTIQECFAAKRRVTSASFLQRKKPKLTHLSISIPGLCRDLYSVSSSDAYSSSALTATTSAKPYFTSRPDTYKEKVGEAVTLQCHVRNLGEYKALHGIFYFIDGTTHRTRQKSFS